MNNKELARYLDLTLLKPEATEAEVVALCHQAVELGVYAVCLNPYRVEAAARSLGGSNVLPISVVGFPFGATDAMIKCLETAYAIESGAREIDMVMNVGAFKDGRYNDVLQEIIEVNAACEDMPLKVIIESALLTPDEIIKACKAAEAGGAAFVKTSTGMHKAGGATEIAVSLMSETVRGFLGVKASGGIRTRSGALSMIAAGATRLGVSDLTAILL